MYERYKRREQSDKLKLQTCFWKSFFIGELLMAREYRTAGPGGSSKTHAKRSGIFQRFL